MPSFLSISEAQETIIVNVSLNQERKGEFFVILKEDGDFLFTVSDIKDMGIEEPKGEIVEIDSEPYISLKSLQGVEFTFDDRSLTIELKVSPSLLPKTTIDLLPSRQINIYYPKDTSVFLNYGADYNAGNALEFKNLSTTNQIGFRWHDFLLLSDSSYKITRDEDTFARLMSNIVYDRRNQMDKLIIGDGFVSSGGFGSTLNIGGISYQKDYRIDPYFKKERTFNMTGSATLPSELEIYLDGERIRTEKVQPGEFDLMNLSYFGGAHKIEVLLRDPFGKETRFEYPFYFTDRLLAKGLHDFSYNLGFLREEFGVESNRYSKLVSSWSHRYGLTDSINVGFRGERGEEVYNLGAEASFVLGNKGVFSMALSGSRHDTQAGCIGSLEYRYEGQYLNLGLNVISMTRDYFTVMDRDFSGGESKHQVTLGGGLNLGKYGDISLSYSSVEQFNDQDTQTSVAAYSKTLFNKFTFSTSYRRTRTDELTNNELQFGLSYHFGRDYSMFTRYRKDKDRNSESLQILKAQPVGEGIGFNANLNRNSSPSNAAYSVAPTLQYNSRYGIHRADYSVTYSQSQREESYNFFTGGAFSFVGNSFGITRPIQDSFGLVKLGNLEGIKVFVNNEEIGKTNSSGKVYIPRLSSYIENQISIDDKSIPIEYSLSDIKKFVAPPFRSGSVIRFEVAKFQAITGTLKVQAGAEVLPAEFKEVKMMVNEKEITFPTGTGGEFYFENVPAGTYKASFGYGDDVCYFDIVIPENNELFIELGDVICSDLK